MATRLMSQDANPIPSIISIDAAQLKSHLALADALAAVPGLHIQTPGGRSGFASVFMNGADPNFTAILLDGVPLNDPTSTRGGAVNLANIETATFSRVDVAQGAFSSIHGSGALAGAINLIVPGSSPQFQAGATVGLGSRSDYFAALSLRGPVSSGLGGSLALHHADDGEGIANAAHEQQAITVKMTPLNSNEGSAASVLLRYSNATVAAFPDSSGGDQFAVRRQLEHRDHSQVLAALSLPILLRAEWRLDLGTTAQRHKQQTDNPGVAGSAIDPFGIPAGSDDTTYENLRAHAAARRTAGKTQWLFGLEQQHETGRSQAVLSFFGTDIPGGFKQRRNTSSFYAEAQQQLEYWALQAGLRLDRYAEGGDESRSSTESHSKVTASASLRYAKPEAPFLFRIAFGTGFKAPSFYALGNPFVGNAALRAESNHSVQATAQWRLGEHGLLDLNLSQSNYSNLIDFVPGPPPRLENRSQVRAQAATLNFKTRVLDRLTLNAFAQYLKTTDRDTNQQLLDRPRRIAGASLRWQARTAWSLSGGYRFVGQRQSFSIPTGITTLPALHEFSLEAVSPLSRRTTLRLKLENLLDDGNLQAPGFTSLGRRARLVIESGL